MKRLSLIVPVYHAEAYLPDLIADIAAQGHDNLQVIFSVDGTDDPSLPILRAAAEQHPFITVIVGENRGVSAARNRALEQADGEYIGFLDADDRITPDYLSALVGLLESSGADAVCCGFRRLYVASGTEDALPVLEGPDTLTDRDGFLRGMLDPRGYTTVVWNKLFRREALCDAEGTLLRFSEDLHIVEDGEYLFRANVNKALFTTRRLYVYYVRRSGAMYGRLSPDKLTEPTARLRIAQLAEGSAGDVRDLARMKYQKGIRDLLFHALLDGDLGMASYLLPELRRYRRELFASPCLSGKEKLKYRAYGPIIRLRLRPVARFLMTVFSNHGRD